MTARGVRERMARGPLEERPLRPFDRQTLLRRQLACRLRSAAKEDYLGDDEQGQYTHTPVVHVPGQPAAILDVSKPDRRDWPYASQQLLLDVGQIA